MTIQLAATQRPRPQSGAAMNGTAAAPANNGGWMKRGAVARAVLEEEKVRAEQRAEQRARERLIPFNFFLRQGEQADIIILDNEVGPCFFEHNIKGEDGKYNVWESCPKEWDACPLCEGAHDAKPSYYVMLLTVMDLRPYHNDRTGETKTHTLKLLRVKQSQMDFFNRQYEKYGSLRGLHLLMSRSATDKSSSIGMPEVVQQYDENTIISTFQHPEIRSQHGGKLIKAANADCYPINYVELFPRPSGDDLRRRYGGAAPFGSQGYNNGGSAGNDDGWSGYDPNAHAGHAHGNPQGGGIQPAAGGVQQGAQQQGHGGQTQGVDQSATTQAPPPAAQPQGNAGGGIQTRAAPSNLSQDLDDDIPF